jgi:gliding motility-associated-like protein
LNYLGKHTPLTIPLPAQTTTYYARWESLCDTSDCDSVKVIIIPTISINKDHTICSGESYTIGISNYTTAGIYIDTLQSVSGCDSIITTNLTVNPTVLNPITKSICEGEIFAVGINEYSTPGNYIDVLKTSLGCDSTVTTILTVNPLPEVSLGADQLLCPGDTITLTPGSGFISYLWSNGSMLSNLIATSTGKYSVTVYNEWCPASDEITINECGTELWFPNAFSPNNDYTNDTFKPVILGTLQTYQINIYDRWGKQIYESNQVNPGWDGTLKGNVCATGLYVYIATYSMGTEPGTQKQQVQRGAFTLLR